MILTGGEKQGRHYSYSGAEPVGAEKAKEANRQASR